jgi:hypothetical protein
MEELNSDSKNSPPSPLHLRDHNGLLTHIDYNFNPDKSINWRSMINKDFLVPNRDSLIKTGNDSSLKEIDVSSLSDNQLLILLGGIKELAHIRGYHNVEYEVIEARQDYVAVKCTIDWMANYETNFKEVKFSSLADAHLENTKDFAKNFLMAIAENRAFIRCVRNFLRINIVGNDEIGKSHYSEASDSLSSENSQPIALLKKTMTENNISFDQIKQGALKKEIDGSQQWSSIEDIPPLVMFKIISGIKNKSKKV